MNRLLLILFVLLVACTPKKESAKAVPAPLLPPGIVVREVPPDGMTARERAMARIEKMRRAHPADASAKKGKMGAAPSPSFPPSWLVPQWYIDGSNATGCASDANSGTSATCAAGGVGPLRTWNELNAKRWGCLGSPTACPRLTQNTTITFLSDDISPSDPIVFLPSVENGTYTTVECALGAAQQVGSGTLNVVTPKNRPMNQALESTFTATTGLTIAPYQLVYNSTHASYAWVNRADGGTWLLTQPIAPITLPVMYTIFPFNTTEVDTWANADAYQTYTPVRIYVTKLSTANVDMDYTNVSSGLYVQHCNLALPVVGDVGESAVVLGDFVFLIESMTTTSMVQFQSNLWNTAINDLFGNSPIRIDGGYLGGVGFVNIGAAGDTVLAGAVIGTSGGNTPIFGGNSPIYDMDFQFGGGTIAPVSDELTPNGEANIGVVYIDTSVTFDGSPQVQAEVGGVAQVYGKGRINLSPGSQLQYPAGLLASTFPLTGGISLSQGPSATGVFTVFTSPAILGGSSFVGDGGVVGAQLGRLTTTGDAGVRSASLLYPLPGSGAAVPGSIQAVPPAGPVELSSRIHCQAGTNANLLSARWTVDQGYAVADAGHPQLEGMMVTALAAGNTRDGGVPAGWAPFVSLVDGGLYARVGVIGDPALTTNCMVQTEVGYGK